MHMCPLLKTKESSAKLVISPSAFKDSKSFMCGASSTGPDTLPWGTPY